MKEVRIKVTEELYAFYRDIGQVMDSSAEEMMEMMLRVCAARIKKKKEGDTYSYQ